MNIMKYKEKDYEFEWWYWTTGHNDEEYIEESKGRFMGEDVPAVKVHLVSNPGTENHIVHMYIYKEDIRKKYGGR